MRYENYVQIMLNESFTGYFFMHVFAYGVFTLTVGRGPPQENKMVIHKEM